MLKLSTKGRYAVRILIFLATRSLTVPSRKQDIAEAENISPDYVEQILMRLRAGGLVKSHRGARGGFTLTRDPHEITVMDVLMATEGPVQIVACEDNDCRRESVCVARSLWKMTEMAVTDIFVKTRISDMAEKVLAMRAVKQHTYEI